MRVGSVVFLFILFFVYEHALTMEEDRQSKEIELVLKALQKYQKFSLAEKESLRSCFKANPSFMAAMRNSMAESCAHIEKKALKPNFAIGLKSLAPIRRKAKHREKSIKEHYLDSETHAICMRTKRVMSFEEFKRNDGAARLWYLEEKSFKKVRSEPPLYVRYCDILKKKDVKPN